MSFINSANYSKSPPPFHLVKEGGVANGEVRKGQYSEPPSQCCVGL